MHVLYHCLYHTPLFYLKKSFLIQDLNFDLKYHKDILQLKFFIVSYVNSLERRKYVAVWFSSIRERIQCWPAPYSYDLTVNSFGILIKCSEQKARFKIYVMMS
jgi:hypothetical protein